jgi:hypothetical protein
MEQAMTLRGIASMIIGLLASGSVAAVDVTVAGLFPNKALVQIGSGPLQTLSIGQKTAEGVALVSVQQDAATFEIEGKRITLGLGHARVGRSSAAASVQLTADVRGHFITDASVNGAPMRFIVDTDGHGQRQYARVSDQARRSARRGCRAQQRRRGRHRGRRAHPFVARHEFSQSDGHEARGGHHDADEALLNDCRARARVKRRRGR